MKKHNREDGFTLIEIVMVLVLLGILAAIAAPKYFDLQATAKLKAAEGAVAEAQARIHATFAQELLLGKSCTDALATAKAINGNNMGDWEVKWTDSLNDEGQIPTVKYTGNNSDSGDVFSKDSTPPLKVKIYAPVCTATTTTQN